MPTLSANDLKTGGIAAIEAVLNGQPEAVISVRGKERFVVMELAHYHYLRECELDAALAQSRADLAAGRWVAESAAAHVARLGEALAGEASEDEPQVRAAKAAGAGKATKSAPRSAPARAAGERRRKA